MISFISNGISKLFDYTFKEGIHLIRSIVDTQYLLRYKFIT